MADPLVAQKAPFPVQVEAGRTYWWCACGRSRTQPFCDGSHKGSTFTPKAFKVDTRRARLLLRLQAQRAHAAVRRLAQAAVSLHPGVPQLTYKWAVCNSGPSLGMTPSKELQ